MDVDELLRKHDIDPAGLEPAPDAATRQDVITRICEQPPRPCTMCGEPSPTARIHPTPDHGPRWVDLCREHWSAVRHPWRGPSTVAGILADIRWAAAEVGLPADAPAVRWL